jgi:hypothetical protein
MFETHSHEWERVGLTQQVDERAIRKARRQALVLIPLLAGVLFLNDYFGTTGSTSQRRSPLPFSAGRSRATSAERRRQRSSVAWTPARRAPSVS